MYAYVCKVILSLSRKRERERGACRRAYLLSYVHERGGVGRGGRKTFDRLLQNRVSACDGR